VICKSGFVLFLRFADTRCQMVASDNHTGGLPTIRVARFFLVQTYKNGKNIPNDHKNIPNGHKLLKNGLKIQMVMKYTNVFHIKTLQNIPKFGFLV
jgi:hypothetical protein